jgi:EH_Signature domain
MKLVEALGELAATVRYLRSQNLATELDASQELLPLALACAQLKAQSTFGIAPRAHELEVLAGQCRDANFSLQGFSLREIRLLSWHGGLLMAREFRQNLSEVIYRGEVRPNLSILSKFYFGAWGEHEDSLSFERLLRFVAEQQSAHSAILALYKKHALAIFDDRADRFICNDAFETGLPLSDVLKKWDIPPGSCLAGCVIEEYLSRSVVLIEEGRSSALEDVLATTQLPGVRLNSFRKTMERLILCDQANRSEEFRKRLEMFIIDHPSLGDPRYSSNAPHWKGIGSLAEQKFRGWRNKLDLVFFFKSVMKDREDRHGRKDFWLGYVDQAHESFVALCPADAQRLEHSLVREKIHYRRIIDSQGVSCFVMRFRGNSADLIVEEFSNVGKARIFQYKSFIENIESIDRQEFRLSELRTDEGTTESFRHMPGWQSRIRNTLARYGVRPR